MTSRGFIKFLPLIFSALALLVVILIIRTKSEPEQSAPAETDHSSEDFLTGMIFTSGLQEGEFGLDADYQLDKYPGSTGDWEENVEGYFLTNNEVAEEFLGKCVKVYGEVKQGWEDMGVERDFMFNGKYTYSRSVLVPERIEEIEYRECIMDYEIEHKYDYSQRREATGRVEIGERPAPDIAYDYRISPERPFHDPGNASGTNATLRYVDLQPTSDEMEIDFLENIGETFQVSGNMAWGYSESRYLVVNGYRILD